MPDAAPEDLRLEPLRWWEIPELLPLERDLFGPDGWSERLFWSELAQGPGRHYLVARDEGVVGYAGLAAYHDEGYVQTVAVRRDRWGGGVGGALVLALLQEADRRGTRAVLLEVRAGDERAQGLYARLGFVQVGRRRGYYQPSGEDAVVMRRPGLVTA